MNKNNKIFTTTRIVILGLIILIMLFLGYQYTRPQEITYITEVAKIGSIKQKVIATGNLNAIDLIDVGAEVSGEIKQLNVKLGDQVKVGDIIAQIDSTTQVNAVAIAEAKLNSYKAKLASAEVQLKIKQINYNREKNLIKKKSTSELNLETAEQNLAEIQATVAEIKANINEAELNLDNANKNLQHTKIISPNNGIVIAIPVSKGQTVNAVQSTPTIIKLADLTKMKIKLNISEGDVSLLKPGLAVEYSILSDPQIKYNTVLNSIDFATTDVTDSTNSTANTSSSSTSGNTIYYYGNAEVDNPDNKFRIGMTIKSSILVKNIENVLVIPATSVNYDEKAQASVEVLTDNNVKETKIITLGATDNVNIQVISGLKEGDKVVLSSSENIDISNNHK